MADEFQINVIGRRYISENEFSEVIDLCSRAYGMDYHPYILTFPGATHVLGRYQGKLVSHAPWVTRWLQCSTMPLWRTAYIEAVATDKHYRRKGYASAVIRRLAMEIKDYDIGGLSTGHTDLYAKLGWQLWRGPLFIRTAHGLIATPEERGVMVLSLPKTPSLDLDTPLSAEWREGELW